MPQPARGPNGKARRYPPPPQAIAFRSRLFRYNVRILSVIVPTYNERPNIRPLIERTVAAFRKLSEPAELIVVDDNSPDGTAEAAEKAARELDAADLVRVVVRTEDRGLAQAVVAGFAAARGDVVAVMDADLSHPPELLADLLAPIRENRADISVASRRIKGGGVSNWPFKRRVISWGAGLLARPLVPIRDTTSGFFAARKRVVESMELRPRGYKIGLEIFARAATQARMVEVPFVFTDRTAGESKLTGGIMLAYLAQLGELYRARYPVFVGYLMFSVVGALGIGVDTVVYNLAYFYAGLERLGLPTGGLLAQTASFLVAATFNFALNRAWTFRDRAADASLARFILVCAVGYVLRSLLFAVVARTLAGESEFIVGNAALAAGIFAASFWNYFGSRRWAFPREAPRQADPPRDAAWIWAVALVWGLALLRLGYSNFLPLADDEAYYWQWSRRLDWGFHDHPPMIAYLIAAGTRFAGASEFGIRLLPIVLASATVWIVSRLASRASSSTRAGLWAAVAFAAAPMLASGSVLATPDTPLVFFWTATLAAAWRAVESGRLGTWLLAGAALGLALISKYTAVILAAGLALALVLSGAGRRALRTAGPWAAAALAAAICLPHLAWLFEQDWAPVRFQLRHGLESKPSGMSGLAGLGRFFALQLGVMTPPLLILAMAALWRGCVRAWEGLRGEDPGPALLAVPALLTLLLFAYASVFSPGSPNWTAPAYPALLALLGSAAASWEGWRKGAALFSIALAAALSLYAHVESAWPIVPYEKGPWLMVRDRRGFAQWADALRSSKGKDGRNALVLAKDYRTASTLAFYLPDRPNTGAPRERGSGAQYRAWHERVRPAGEKAWYFTNSDADPAVEQLFETFERVGSYWETRLGVRILKEIHAYYGTLRRSAP